MLTGQTAAIDQVALLRMRVLFTRVSPLLFRKRSLFKGFSAWKIGHSDAICRIVGQLFAGWQVGEEEEEEEEEEVCSTREES